jgi:protease IV
LYIIELGIGNCFAGVFEKVGIEPQIQRIGKYKSAGDQLTRKNISEENREVLTALLDNIYSNWLDKVSTTKGALALNY